MNGRTDIARINRIRMHFYVQSYVQFLVFMRYLQMNKEKLKVFSAALLSVLVSAAVAYAGLIDEIQVLKISPRDERAVIKTRDGELKVINVGDVIRVRSSEFKVQSAELRVVEIAKGRVVFEEKTDDGMETVIIRVGDGKQNIERIKKVADKPPLLYKPQADLK